MGPLLKQVPEPEAKLLRYLLGFLYEVSLHAETNKMQAANLAIVMAPNLLKQQNEDEKEMDALAMLGNSGKAGKVVEALIARYPAFYPNHTFTPFLS